MYITNLIGSYFLCYKVVHNVINKLINVTLYNDIMCTLRVTSFNNRTYFIFAYIITFLYTKQFERIKYNN
jgi:hypothetical protein